MDAWSMKEKPTKWATASRMDLGSGAVARFARSIFQYLFILGFRFAPPQALCFHPLRGFFPFAHLTD
jgi:hypothetical protein